MGPTRVTTAAALPLYKSVKDSSRLTVTAALTYPGFDRAGDRLNPAGGRYELHKADPWVGYEHLRWSTTGTDWVHADARNASDRPVVIGKATGPGGYAVEHRAVTIDGKAVALPFGTTHFDPKDRLGSQMFAMVEDDTLPAVSLELTLVPGMFKSLAASPLEPHRPAYDMAAWSCLGWVHCAEPVNPGALTLRKSLTPATERAIRVAELGKVRGEVAHPLILKAFRDRYAPALGKSATVTGNYDPVRKAMNDETAALDPAYEPDAPEEAAEPTGGGSTPTVQTLYQIAQNLADIKAQAQEMLSGSEHVKGKKFATKLLQDLDDTAADATEMAAKIEAELGAKEPEGDTEAEPEEPEPDIAEGDNEPDEDGVLKAIKRRPAVFKAIKRFTVAEYHKAAPVAAVAAPVEPAADDIVAQLEALQQSDPDAYARLARRAERKLRLA